MSKRRSKRKVPPTGQLRRSQVLTTFGPGAMVDLPEHAVIIGGLETWMGRKEPIAEERLARRLADKLDVPELSLYAPPIDSDEPAAPRTGITAFQFPTWFLGQVHETWTAPDGRVYRTRPLLPFKRLVQGGYLDRNRKIKPVVPVRFVQACTKGHISDVDWYSFVRRDFKTEPVGNLWLDEGGAGNDFAEIYVRDEKNGNQRRPLADAMVRDNPVLGRCQGRQPWLGPRVFEAGCKQPNRLLTRSASNAYFAHTVRVISLPEADAPLREAVDRVWEDHLQYMESQDDVRKERRRANVAAALEEFSDAAVWAEIARRLSDAPTEDKSFKQAEVETLLAQRDSVGEDRPEGDFYARRHPFGWLPRAAEGLLDRLVLVHRLREVNAQIGFTRFDASSVLDIDDDLTFDIELAPLARELSWLPAHENRGEGVFLSFVPTAIRAWLRRPGVKKRQAELIAGFETWAERKNIENPRFPGLPYIMLHSLAHLLITALALDCGYSASAISERVYAGEYGYGILLYTGTAGSEGTLGGLVDVGRHIGRHLARALELGRLCSNDPVCAQHEPADPHEERFLHGAACHGCLLIAETSCERRNDLLDRALVVPTVATPSAAFFTSEP